jgi:predicted HicB family RNase H-like nuclease
MFLKDEVQVLEQHLKETEEKYLLCCAIEETEPPRKRAKKSKKTEFNNARENAIAELAATLRVNCIKKVCAVFPYPTI